MTLENNIIDEGAVSDYNLLIEKADVIISGLYPTAMVGWLRKIKIFKRLYNHRCQWSKKRNKLTK